MARTPEELATHITRNVSFDKFLIYEDWLKVANVAIEFLAPPAPIAATPCDCMDSCKQLPNCRAVPDGRNPALPPLPPVMVGEGRDREDMHPAWKVWRKRQPRSYLLRPGETENELTRAYDAIVAHKSAPIAAQTEPDCSCDTRLPCEAHPTPKERKTFTKLKPATEQVDAARLEVNADNLLGVYCGGNLEMVAAPIFWEGWQRVADFVNGRAASLKQETQPGQIDIRTCTEAEYQNRYGVMAPDLKDLRLPAASSSPLETPAPDSLTKLRVIGGNLRMNLHDAAILYPKNFNQDGILQLISEWDDAVKEVVVAMCAKPAAPLEPETPAAAPEPARKFYHDWLQGECAVCGETAETVTSPYCNHPAATPASADTGVAPESPAEVEVGRLRGELEKILDITESRNEIRIEIAEICTAALMQGVHPFYDGSHDVCTSPIDERFAGMATDEAYQKLAIEMTEIRPGVWEGSAPMRKVDDARLKEIGHSQGAQVVNPIQEMRQILKDGGMSDPMDAAHFEVDFSLDADQKPVPSTGDTPQPQEEPSVIPSLWRIDPCKRHEDYMDGCRACEEEVLTVKTERAYRAGYKSALAAFHAATGKTPDALVTFKKDPDNGAGLHAVFVGNMPIHHFNHADEKRVKQYMERLKGELAATLPAREAKAK